MSSALWYCCEQENRWGTKNRAIEYYQKRLSPSQISDLCIRNPCSYSLTSRQKNEQRQLEGFFSPDRIINETSGSQTHFEWEREKKRDRNLFKSLSAPKSQVLLGVSCYGFCLFLFWKSERDYRMSERTRTRRLRWEGQMHYWIGLRALRIVARPTFCIFDLSSVNASKAH